MATSGQQKFQILREREEHSIIIKIKFKLYEISTELLLKVFSTCGNIETVEIFRSGEEFHSRVCFQDKDSAIRALNWYNGRCLYDFWCKLELFQGFQVTNRSRKTEVPTQETKEVEVAPDISTTPEIDKGQSKIEETPIEGEDNPFIQDSPRDVQWEVEAPLGSPAGNLGVELIDDSITPEIEAPVPDVSRESDKPAVLQPSTPENENSLGDLQLVNDNSEVNLKRYNVEIYDNVRNELAELVNLLIEWIEIRLVNSSTNPVGYLGNFSACKVFVEMTSLIMIDCCLDFDSFEPKSVSFGMTTRNWPYDRGKFDVGNGKRGMWTAMAKVGHSLLDRYSVLELVGRVFDNSISFMSDATLEIGGLSFVFDPGGSDRDWMQTFGMRLVFDPGWVIAYLVEVKFDCRPEMSDVIVVVEKLFQTVSSGCWCGAERMDRYCISDCILTFDPGGVGSVFRYTRQQTGAVIRGKKLLQCRSAEGLSLDLGMVMDLLSSNFAPT